MKKNIYLVSLALLMGISFVFTSCDNEDTTAPIVIINGNAIEFVNIGDTWTDDGATASDDEDGDISALIITSGTVETDSVGSYLITYSVSDAAGNPGSATRTVNVQLWQGTYDSEHVCSYSGTTVPATKEIVNNLSSVKKIEIENFGGFAGVTINADVQGQAITITTTSFTFNSNTYTLKGTGNILPSSEQFILNYTLDEGLATEDVCVGTYDAL